MKNTQRNKQQEQLHKQVSKLQRYINTHKGDTKYVTSYFSGTPTVLGTVNYISGVAQGDSPSERAGSALNSHSLDINVTYKMTASCNIRTLIVRDLMNQGTSPVVSDVLQTPDLISSLDYANCTLQKRFVIHKDITRHFTIGGNLYNSDRLNVKTNLKIRYSSTSAAAGDALSNAFFIISITDVASAGTVDYWVRHLYTDE
jgi:hypothetical protein